MLCFLVIVAVCGAITFLVAYIMKDLQDRETARSIAEEWAIKRANYPVGTKLRSIGHICYDDLSIPMGAIGTIIDGKDDQLHISFDIGAGYALKKWYHVSYIIAEFEVVS
jgi:hypothetical protein